MGVQSLVCLTQRGRRAQEAARKIVAEIEGDSGELLGAEDFVVLRALLQRLHEALWPT